MTLITLAQCSCPTSDDFIICAKCGGMARTSTDIFMKLDAPTREWITKLDNDSALQSTMATYMSIDRQIRQGIPLTNVVKEATQQIGFELNDFRVQVERNVAEVMVSLRNSNAESTKQIRDMLNAQIETMVVEVKNLVEQGKSVKDVEARVREVTLTIQNYLTAVKLPGVKGEIAEINVIQELHDAFIGQSNIAIEPIGGSDATDILIKFIYDGIEIGRCLVEVKSRKTWSNDYLDQVRTDMKRYSVPFACLVVDKLPKNAKGKNFHIDIAKGLVVTSPAELVVPTITMFYEIHVNSFKLQNRTLSLESLSSDRDLLYYLDDNMKILEDCKKISDQAEDSAKKIKACTTSIATRLQENNRALAQILSKLSVDSQGA
ncbi:MAG: DUF2130 domain-containing protein [Candidatus Bathyarchaeia archaeon]